MERKTKVQVLSEILEVVTSDEHKAFIEKEIDSLKRKAERAKENKKPSKTKVENTELAEKLLALMDNKPHTASELVELYGNQLGVVTSSKMVGVLNILLANSQVTKNNDKIHFYYVKA